MLPTALLARALMAVAASQAPAGTPPPPRVLFGATFEGYYSHNTNRPPDGNNAFRAYDVKTGSFGLQQAAVVVDAPPAIDAGRRYGLRVDLQFGEAVATLQGSPANEPRPDLYRNLWQAYGTYVLPVGSGLTLDFGKFASPLGLETNYAKDDDHFTRALLFDFLPFYHSGARLSYAVNDRVTVYYMLTNGAQQTEDFNTSPANHGMVIAKLPQHLQVTASAYESREPSGPVHIYDGQLTWAPAAPLTFGLDANHTSGSTVAPGAISPDTLTGVGLYGRVSRKSVAGALRYEHLDDAGGLFGGIPQTLQEITATGEWKAPEGFLARLELRRDWSDHSVFPASSASLSRSQTTITAGLVWWIGTKKGSW
jgi:hypothetical protein